MSDIQRDGGGPAFPTETSHGWYAGMALRDWFAGQALQYGQRDSPHIIAAWAYRVADAMLAARLPPPPEGEA